MHKTAIMTAIACMFWAAQAPVEAGSAKQDIEFITSDIVKAYEAKDLSKNCIFLLG